MKTYYRQHDDDIRGKTTQALDLCNGGMIWSCCVPRDRVIDQAITSIPLISALTLYRSDNIFYQIVKQTLSFTGRHHIPLKKNTALLNGHDFNSFITTSSSFLEALCKVLIVTAGASGQPARGRKCK